MTKTKIDKQELKDLLKKAGFTIGKLKEEFYHDILIMDLDEWKISDSSGWNKEVILVPVFIVDDKYVCCFDCGYGQDIVFDLKTKQIHRSKQGVFTDDFVFVSDYYSQPDGAFYERVK